MEKETRNLNDLALECEKLAEACDIELSRLVAIREKGENQNRFFASAMFSIGRILQTFIMLIYFALLWGTDTLQSHLMRLGSSNVINEPTLDIPILNLQLSLSENVWVQIIQFGIPFGVSSALLGVVAIIFLKNSMSFLGIFIMLCKAIVSIISFAVWVLIGMYEPFDVLTILGFIIFLLILIPGIPGFFMIAGGSFGAEEKQTQKWSGFITACLTIFVLVSSVWGVRHIWPEEGFTSNFDRFDNYYAETWGYSDWNNGDDWWYYEDTLQNVEIPSFPGISLERNAATNNPSYVMLMQERLNAIGTYQENRLAIDGSFGPLTQAAVFGFQRLIGSYENGIVDEWIWYEMFMWPVEYPIYIAFPELPALFRTTVNLNLRELPITDSEVITVVSADTEVLVIDVYQGNDEWFVVEYDGQSGFMSSNFLIPAQ